MPGPRVFSVADANALIPGFETAFREFDRLRERLKATKIKLSALEMIWGQELFDGDCPDHSEGQSLVAELKSLEEDVRGVLAGLAEEGATVKDVNTGLVDVYHVRDGQLVFLCWKRGEPAFEAWHHVDAGFADREPL